MTDRCGNPLNSHRTCDEMLQPIRRPTGRTVFACVRCMWRDAGRCWQCGALRSNDRAKGVYCTRCAAARLAHSNEAARRKPDAKAKRQAYDRARYLRRAA